MCSQRANATVLSHEHVSLRTERDASVLAASERSSLFDGTCLLAHGARSKCALAVVRTQQFGSPEHAYLRTERHPSVLIACENAAVCRMNRSSCARRELQVCSRCENAAVFLMDHVSMRAERDLSVLVACERSSVFAGT